MWVNWGLTSNLVKSVTWTFPHGPCLGYFSESNYVAQRLFSSCLLIYFSIRAILETVNDRNGYCAFSADCYPIITREVCSLPYIVHEKERE
jgi:hypothetical protein